MFSGHQTLISALNGHKEEALKSTFKQILIFGLSFYSVIVSEVKWATKAKPKYTLDTWDSSRSEDKF